MNIVVDTSVWSLVLRRNQVDDENSFVVAFKRHLERGDSLHLIGNILQELLDGIRHHHDFERLVKLMTPFPLVPLGRSTYISASQLRNHCQQKGVLASGTDFLIAAACIEQGYPLLTSDKDFTRIAKQSDLIVLQGESE